MKVIKKTIVKKYDCFFDLIRRYFGVIRHAAISNIFGKHIESTQMIAGF